MRELAAPADLPRAGGVRRAHLTLALLAAVAIGAAGAVGLHGVLSGARSGAKTVFTGGLHADATWAPGTRAAPAVNLRDQTGHLFSLASLRGRTVAMVFFDSHCTQACPLEGRALAAAERALPAAQRPVLVAVSVNLLDTPASVRKAMGAWGLARLGGWHWLMGTRGQLEPVWRRYHIYVSPKPVDGDIVHTEALYAIDRRGYERAAYLYPFLPRFVTLDFRAIARFRRAG